jgi:nucleoside-diphosphate-sugar epimerase
MSNILITGHKGFIGRHFSKRLSEMGHKITGLDIKDGEEYDVRKWFRHPDFTQVFDMVIHCAAIVEGRCAIDLEPMRVATNLSIDSEFFNWAVRTKQKKLICFSSAASYPLEVQNSDGKIVSTEDQVSLTNFKAADQTYGFAKLALEVMADVARKAVPEMEVYVFRPFSCYGEDQSLDYPFSSFIKRIKDKANPFECWGDGEQVRDWIHNEDLLNAILAAIDKKIDFTVNLCTGRGVSMNEIIKMMMDISGHHAPIEHKFDKPVGVKYRVGDPTKMNTFYKAKISLEEGIKRCFEV